jgi:hypothetical protein
MSNLASRNFRLSRIFRFARRAGSITCYTSSPGTPPQRLHLVRGAIYQSRTKHSRSQYWRFRYSPCSCSSLPRKSKVSTTKLAFSRGLGLILSRRLPRAHTFRSAFGRHYLLQANTSAGRALQSHRCNRRCTTRILHRGQNPNCSKIGFVWRRCGHEGGRRAIAAAPLLSALLRSAPAFLHTVRRSHRRRLPLPYLT